MPTAYQPSQPRPYRIGHKIRILLGKAPGDNKVTFGKVVSVSPDNVPVVKYQDYSDVSLGSFDRVVKKDEVRMRGEFETSIWKY